MLKVNICVRGENRRLAKRIARNEMNTKVIAGNDASARRADRRELIDFLMGLIDVLFDVPRRVIRFCPDRSNLAVGKSHFRDGESATSRALVFAHDVSFAVDMSGLLTRRGNCSD